MINWATYPPAAHEPRIKDYGRFEGLFLAQHQTIFKVKTGGPFQMSRYIVANFAGILSTLSADMLFGEPPDYLVTDEANTGAADAVERLVGQNGLRVLSYEAALASSFRGDAVLKVRWGIRNPVDPEAEPEALIEEVPGSIYFPELSEDDIRQVNRVSLAWQKADPDPSKRNLKYVRVEEHEAGLIRNRLFRQAGGKVEEVDITMLPEYAGLEPEVETGLMFIPVFHIPNFRYGSRFWGISDYVGLESLIEALNSRISSIDAVLDKHVSPKLAVPPSMMGEDDKIDRNKLDLIPLEAGEQIPQYILWDASLQAAYKEIDQLIELLFILSETGPSIFGLDKYGVAQSGTALRLRLIRTIAKINRKRLYFDGALKQVLYAAQLLEKQHGGASYEPCPVSIAWADGLPEDMMEMVQLEAQRLASGNTSIESSIRRLDGPAAVEGEMERIAEDESRAVTFGGPRQTQVGEGGQQ
jgi:hypothetical protein